jgi:phosphate-selective porin OprO and OprP
MYRARLTAAVAIGLFGAGFASRAYAQSAGNDSAEISLLKQQLRSMEQKLDKLQKQTAANTDAAAAANAKAVSAAKVNAAMPVKGPIAPSDVVVKMTNNRPTICTADDQNCVSITSRLHLDVGGYNYRPNSAATVPQRLDDGFNARRARIGIIGKFLGDWNYALIYDFGGSSDGFSGAAVGSLPGGGLTGLENAYISYTGFNPFGGKLAIEGGYLDVPFSLDEATSSNDILFMERSSSQVISTNIAANDFRAAAGGRWFTDSFWIGAYATGPTSGAIHSASVVTPNGTTEQLGTTVRVAGQVVNGKGYSLHIGGGAEFLIAAPHNLVTGAQTLTLSDRPELRIDPTTIISTGALQGVSGAQVYNAEAAATYGPLFFQGEYFWDNVDRGNIPGLTSVKFDGGYAQASWVLTGETHAYNSALAAYSGIVPQNPFSVTGGGWGAWEIAGRISTMNLNDQLATANGVAGGRQTVYTAGLNWYANRNVRLMFNYLHGDISKQVSAINSGNAGATFDAFAMRTQIAF